MAWRSSGTTNGELVDNLKRFGVIHSPAVEEGFRAVDRRFFVPRNRQEMAHSDQPLKVGNVHISAPHIYGSVLEALELHPNSSLSFLNLGSGTGYLSCIVAHILGPTSSNVGIELHSDVVDHCRIAMQCWRHDLSTSSATTTAQIPPMDVIRGNALEIDKTQGEGLVGFDRIYIGASVERKKLASLAALLRPGGILVGPVDDELIKVVRIGTSNTRSAAPVSSIPRSFRGQPPPLSDDFSHQVLSGVRFAPLLASPSLTTVIPSRVWNPSIHRHYPDSFRRSCKEILLCARSPTAQPRPPPVPVQEPSAQHVNVAGQLPRALWMEILSYTHRDWFEKPQSEVEFLRQRLVEEQTAARRAQEAKQEVETRLHMVERERDVYRLLALRWQSRLQSIAAERGGEDDSIIGVDDIAEAAATVFANEPLLLRLGGLNAMMRQFRNDSDDDDDNEEDNDHDEDDHEASNEMEEESDTEDMEEAMEHGDAMSVSPTESSSDHLVGRPHQARTVSISSDDL